MTTFLVVLAAFGALVAFVYNRLVAARQAVRNSWSQITVQLKRRHELIPNLVNAVKGAMDFERTTLERVIQARNAALAATTPADSIQAEGALSAAMGRFMAIAEAYPDLKSNTQIGQLMEEVTTTENRIAFARQAYNDAVEKLNVSVESFPNVLFAGAFGFSHEPMFDVPESERAAIDRAPEVKL
jgi:LemA protein